MKISKVFNFMIWNLLIGSVYLMIINPVSAAEKVINWRMQAHMASGDVYQQCQLFADDIERMSAGRIKIKVVPAGSLVPSSDTFDAVNKGMLDATQNWGGYWIGFIPEAKIESRVPVKYSTDQYRYMLYEKGMLERIRKVYAKKNIMWLPAAAGCDTGVWSTKPLKSLNDLKMAKIRAAGTDGIFWKKMGAQTVFMPVEELYTSLAVKNIDGVATSLNVMYMFKHYEMCKYVTLPAFASGMLAYLINMNKWNELPSDLQAIVENAAKKSFWSTSYEAYFMEGSAKRDIALEEMKTKYNVEYLEWDKEVQEKMKQVSSEMMDEFAKNSPDSAELVEIMNDFKNKLK